MKKEIKEVKTVRLTPSLIKKIKAMAEKENRNFNNMVEVILLNA